MEHQLATRLWTALAGRYTFERELGRGGTAVVYLVRDIKHDREVALKVLLPQVAAAIGAERFQREITIAAKLTHPHILPLYDSGEAGGLLYYVMPFLRGESLRDRLGRKKTLAIDEAIRIGIEVARALERAHADGVVHRDIKPENILLESGYAVVADFGIARAKSEIEDGPLTQTGIIVGTPRYMSPEQTVGAQDLDGRSDLYSLACVVFEMLAGRPPYTGNSMRELLSRHAMDAVPSVRTYRADVPEHVDIALSKALAKDPEARHGSAMEFASALSTQGATHPGGWWGRLRSAFAKPGAAQPMTSHGIAAVTPPAPAGRTAVGDPAAVAGPNKALTSPAHFPTPFQTTPSGRPPIDSLAVLPFTIMSGDADSEYLSEGITESIMNKLSSLTGLRVVPRSVVFRYKGRDTDASLVGAEVNARAVVTGRIMQRGTTLIVKAELVDTATESQLWGEQYNRQISDIFAVQEEMAGEITRSLRLKLSGDEAKGLAKRFTENTEAYQEYLRGRYHWNKRTVEGLRNALGHFQKAIELDPSYALAYTGLADTYNILGYYNNQRPREAYAKGRAAAVRALAIDENLTEGHASMGYVQIFYDLDWPGARRSFERALEISPNYATAHHWFAWYFFMVEDFAEGLARMRRAQELDPLSLIINDHLGYALLLAGKLEEALDQLTRTRELDPTFPWTYWRLGSVYLELGRTEDAIEAFDTVVAKTKGGVALGYLGLAYTRAGRTADAQAVLARMLETAKTQFVSPLELALVRAGLGETEAALVDLESAYEERVSDFARVKLLPWPDSIRRDPRFARLLAQINIKP